MNDFNEGFQHLLLQQTSRDFGRDEVNRLCREIDERARHLANLVQFHDIKLTRLQDVRLSNALDWIDDARFPENRPKWPATVEEDMKLRDMQRRAAE